MAARTLAEEEALLGRMEAARDAIIGGAQSYEIDVSGTTRRVTRVDMAVLDGMIQRQTRKVNRMRRGSRVSLVVPR